MEGVADYTVDMTNMSFEDNKFDYIIANHVLEHIENEAAAVSELKRCIKKNGKIILSFPVTMETDTFEIPGLEKAEEKIYYYGQEDHVRLYGKDFKERLQNYGLGVAVYSPKDFLSQKMIDEIKVMDDDILLVCSCD